MDGGRYGLQQSSWENSSALESYDPIHESDLRGGGLYASRRYTEGALLPGEGGGPLYSRGAYQGDPVYEREGFPAHGWSTTTRRRTLEEEIALHRGAQRLEKVSYSRESFREHPADRIRRDHPLDRARGDVLERDSIREIPLERVSSRTGSRDRDSYDGDADWDFRRGRSLLRGSRESSRDLELAELSRLRSDEPSRLRNDEPSRLRNDDISRLRGDEIPRPLSEDVSPRERALRRRGADREIPRRRKDRDSERSRSRSRDRNNWSPDRGQGHERGRSSGHDDRDWGSRRSRSPRSRSRGAGGRESSYEDSRSERRRDRESSRHLAASALPPSATLVVKGLSQRIMEDDLYQALADWGPLKHVRVIKERNSGISRGFAFVDFPDVEAAQKMMESVGFDGLVVDGRRLYFEYSSKPTGGPGALQAGASGRGSSTKAGLAAADWMCTVCGCNNFARRVLCFQCNEGRTDDSPAADMSAASGPAGRRGSEAGPTHVLVVRGLEESVNEESLHCEFSKFAAIKDLRLVRDKYTSVSRGFAFIHFHSVEDAAKALEATNGIALDKSGQLLRVAFAKSIGPASATPSQGSAAAAAAIEAATFAQQYDMAGWAPKEYNPADNVRGNESEAGVVKEGENGAPQSGFVWDEASGYYYDAASGFYYDGNRGLYYDGNSGVWYTYDQETQQYTAYVEPTESVATNGATGTNSTPTSNAKSVVISAPPVVTLDHDAETKKPTLAEAVAAAAEAAKQTAKKERERMKEREKEIRLAGKGISLGAAKKKMNTVMSVWKQRQHEGLAPSIAGDETHPASSDSHNDAYTNNTAAGRSAAIQAAPKFRSDNTTLQSASTPNKSATGRGMSTLGRGGGNPFSGNYHPTTEGAGRARPVLAQSSGRGVSVFGSANSSVGSGGAVGRGSGRGRGLETGVTFSGAFPEGPAVTPFKTDASALGSYAPPSTGVKRRFTEAPQMGYRDRAAERRNLYGSTLPGDLPETDGKEKGKEMPFPPGVGGRGAGVGRISDMPFPPGVGGSKLASGGPDTPGVIMAGPESQSFEVITAEKALDERNVGNRMLRSMGWQEGSGLGKEGTGIVEPVLAQGAGERAGLGSQSQQKKADARFETQPGDSYRIVIQKKALARFHEMI